MGVAKNLTGGRYGYLLVVGPAQKQGPGTWWNCRCDCGNHIVKQARDLSKHGWVQSCGCRPALAKSIQKRLRAQIDPRLDWLHAEQKRRP